MTAYEAAIIYQSADGVCRQRRLRFKAADQAEASLKVAQRLEGIVGDGRLLRQTIEPISRPTQAQAGALRSLIEASIRELGGAPATQADLERLLVLHPEWWRELGHTAQGEPLPDPGQRPVSADAPDTRLLAQQKLGLIEHMISDLKRDGDGWRARCPYCDQWTLEIRRLVDTDRHVLAVHCTGQLEGGVWLSMPCQGVLGRLGVRYADMVLWRRGQS